MESPAVEQNAGAGAEITEQAVTALLTLHLQPIRADLLGLVLKTGELEIALAAESGEGRLLGNLVRQLLAALNQLDLASAVGEFTNEAGDTLTSFAHLASGRKLEQGTEIARILAGMAGQKVRAGWRRVLGRGAARAEPAS